jgi:hypothetical protein
MAPKITIIRAAKTISKIAGFWRKTAGLKHFTQYVFFVAH